MARTGSVAVRRLIEFLSDPDTGLEQVVAGLAIETGVELKPLSPEQIMAQNVAADLAERATAVKYPVVLVYTDRARNLLTEKFRTFSGKVRTVAEIRVSQDRLEGVETQTRLYVDAITQVLDTNRGSWGEGAYFTGGYEVIFDPVKHGGKNFLQAARVSFEVDVSI
ncbi:MAG TPA: hypothetical protein VGP79_11625 [Bryobacteraceae bacterium]|jgi:hypothetical protein|nr:hypothetical protein [Bryobacteraceae bacterium]